MQNEITTSIKLLDELGRLEQPGWARHPYYTYSRESIKASKWRIKEWDYYAILNQEYGCSLTIADLGYSALISVVFLDFIQRKVVKKTKLLWFTFGKLGLPQTSLEGNVMYQDHEFKVEFIRHQNERILNAWVKKFDGLQDFNGSFRVQDCKDESLVIATPWDGKPKAFYYNQKINCMPTTGQLTIGNKTVQFHPNQSFTVLDWGRGVWTYKNTWYWSNASGMIEGKRFGFNLGYGFGNTSKATENMVFYDGIAHKLDQVTFTYDAFDYLKPWQFRANDGRLELTMTPIVDRQDDLNAIIIKNLGHQVFGIFSGYVILDDQTRLSIENVIGFAEVITNHY